MSMRIMGLIGHEQENQYMHHGKLRRNRERERNKKTYFEK